MTNDTHDFLDPAAARRIFEFDEVFSLRAAQEQAEKKKLGAFGVFARYNPLNRPREETVQLVRQELRYEPFWHVQALRAVDYDCQVTYLVPVANPHAKLVVIDGKVHDVGRTKDKARIEVAAVERCHRKMSFERFIDGLGRDVKPSTLESYVRKFRYTEVEQLVRPDLVKPLTSMVAAQQLAVAELHREAVNATEIHADRTGFERTHLYARPVYAFEYRWVTADKSGVIEVDGLTGEVVEDGRWFRDKVDRIVTREMLIELGADAAGALVPGGSIAVKLIGKLTEPGT